MGKFFEALAAVSVGAAIATSSAVTNTCDTVPQPVCEAAQITYDIGDATSHIPDDSTHTDAQGNNV